MKKTGPEDDSYDYSDNVAWFCRMGHFREKVVKLMPLCTILDWDPYCVMLVLGSRCKIYVFGWKLECYENFYPKGNKEVPNGDGQKSGLILMFQRFRSRDAMPFDLNCPPVSMNVELQMPL
ncbi:hypothetical protein LINGRAHAP2_LOCUS17381 [Linum grandiflorum]